jgi:hypothetical protein
MKSIAVAAMSLFLLSAAWGGSGVSPAPAIHSAAEALKTRTPKPAREAATKTPPEKDPKASKTPKPGKTPKGRKVIFSGEVLVVGEAGLTIRTGAGEEIYFRIDGKTGVKIPTLKDATAADIRIGVKVHIRAVAEADGSFTALQISVSPGQPPAKHHVGEVTAYEAGASITILAHDGNEYTFLITEETKILPAERADALAVGRRVTIISPRDVTGGPFVAKGIVVHPETGAQGTPEETPTPTPTPTQTRTPTPTGTPTLELKPGETAAPDPE